MENVRVASSQEVFPRHACTGCGDNQGHWDCITGKAYCPNCLEALAMGEAEPLIARADRCHCVVCRQEGTLSFRTFPLHWHRPVELDLCGEHLRALIGRRLGPHAFEQLRRQLYAAGIDVAQVFLLHDAFYDINGRALQPATDY